jgi:hypothetical protein
MKSTQLPSSPTNVGPGVGVNVTLTAVAFTRVALTIRVVFVVFVAFTGSVAFNVVFVGAGVGRSVGCGVGRGVGSGAGCGVGSGVGFESVSSPQ